MNYESAFDRVLRATGALALLSVPVVLAASSVSGLTTFVNGEVADAEQVNANFTAITDAVNDNNSRINALATGQGASTTLYTPSALIRFTPCGQAGPVGPTLADCQSSYSGSPNAADWLSDPVMFTVVGGVQYFRVPQTGDYELTAAGARSGPSTNGGLGRGVQATFALNAGEILRIVVGQQGEGNGARLAGGGGASAVAVHRMGIWVPLLIGGGGGGISENSPNSPNGNRNAFAPGTRPNDSYGGRGAFYSASYSSGLGYYWPGGGGGGWSTQGQDGTIGQYNTGQPTGGRALSAPSPMGGMYLVDTTTHDGGFGGGGATGRNSGSAGGGGGWWGGNASYAGVSQVSDDTTHLGGGSYSANPSFTDTGTRNGPGDVTIELL